MAVEVKGPAEDHPALPAANTGVRQDRTSGVSGDPLAASYLRIIIDFPPEAAREFKQLMHQTGDDLPNLVRKALGLYKLSKEAVREGKFVGIADAEDSLETEFVGF
jgi:hypothetical protein